VNYWWDTHAYQQPNTISPPSATVYVRSALVMTHLRRSWSNRHHRDRPGLRLALAACRAGDTLVVTKLDRLARSPPDARDILDELTRRNVKLSLGGSIHDPTDPVGRLLFNVFAMVAEFESDLIKMRTREGMKVAKAKGRLRGKQPKLKPNQARHLLELHDSGNSTKPNSPNCSASGDPRFTAPSTGCGINLSNPSGHSATLYRRRRTPQMSAPQKPQPTN
jgi:hypothetical protein